nr:uncharacterized protein LOC105845959 [Hydra vulgaris]
MCNCICCIVTEAVCFLLCLMGLLLLFLTDKNSSYFIAGVVLIGVFGIFCFCSFLILIFIICYSGNCYDFVDCIKTVVSYEWRKSRSQNVSRVQSSNHNGVTQSSTLSVLPIHTNSFLNENNFENVSSTVVRRIEGINSANNLQSDPPIYEESFINAAVCFSSQDEIFV